MTAAGEESAGGMSPRQIALVTTAALSTLLFATAQTIASVLLPQMRGALSATPDQIAWVVTFNLVATAVGMPLTGWLAGRFGWRATMFWASLGFTLATLGCALANSLEALVLARFAQGLLGAPIMPLGQAILLASFPRPKHALVITLWTVGGMTGPMLGPVLGGVMADAYDWRWAFYAMLPLGAVVVLGSAFAIPDEGRRAETKLDWTGFLALSVAIAAAQLMLDRGQRLDWFDSAEIVAEAFVAVLALWIFAVHCLTRKGAFIDPRLFLDRNFAIGLALAFAFGTLMYTPTVLFPSLLRELRGFPEALIGYVVGARGLGTWVSFLIVVPLTRLSARWTCAFGFACQAWAVWEMAQVNINLTAWHVALTNALQGFGMGLSFTAMSVLAFSTLERSRMTEGNAIYHLMRNFGSSVFISMTVSFYVRSAATSYAELTPHVSPFNELFAFPGVVGLWSIEEKAGLARLSGEVARQAAMLGYINAFQLLTAAAVVAIPLAMIARRAVAPGR